MSGKVVHFEIPFDDGDRARKFYSEAFGWTINEIPDLHYSIVQTGPTGEGGFPTDVGYIGGGMLKRESPADRPVITVDVEDIDEALKRIEELGGMTVLGSPGRRRHGLGGVLQGRRGQPDGPLAGPAGLTVSA